MKILHVVRQFYPAKGGLEDHVLNLAIYQLQKSNEVTIFTLNKNFQNNKNLKEIDYLKKIKIHRFSYIGSKRYPISFLPLKKFNEFDIIHIHAFDFFLDYISLLKRVGMVKKKVLVTTHGLFFHTKFLNLLKEIYFHTVTRFSLKKVNHVISVSHQDKEKLKKIKIQSLYIPNGVIEQKFGLLKNRQNKNFKNYLFIGRPAPQKNLLNLIKYFQNLKMNDITLTIIVPYVDKYVTKISNLIKNNDSKNIILHSKISDDKILKIIEKSDFVISASTYEGFGIAIIELMSYGLIPILNNRVSPFKNFINQSNSGFLFNDEFSDFKNTIHSSLNSKSLEQMKKNSIKYSKLYSWETISSQIMKLYKS